MKQLTINVQIDDNGDVVAIRGASNSQGAAVASPGGSSTIHDSAPAAGGTDAPEVSSEVDEMVRMQTGKPIPTTRRTGWWDDPQVAPALNRPQITLVPGRPEILPPVAVRTVFELTVPRTPCPAKISVPGNGGTLEVDLVGKASGEVTGSAEYGVGAASDGPDPDGAKMEDTQLNSFRFRQPVTTGQYANLFFTFTGGDSVLLLAVNPG